MQGASQRGAAGAAPLCCLKGERVEGASQRGAAGAGPLCCLKGERVEGASQRGAAGAGPLAALVMRSTSFLLRTPDWWLKCGGSESLLHLSRRPPQV